MHWDGYAEVFIVRATPGGYEARSGLCYYDCNVMDIRYKCLENKDCHPVISGTCYDYNDLHFGMLPSFFYKYSGGNIIPLHGKPWEYIIDLWGVIKDYVADKGHWESRWAMNWHKIKFRRENYLSQPVTTQYIRCTIQTEQEKVKGACPKIVDVCINVNCSPGMEALID